MEEKIYTYSALYCPCEGAAISTEFLPLGAVADRRDGVRWINRIPYKERLPMRLSTAAADTNTLDCRRDRSIALEENSDKFIRDSDDPGRVKTMFDQVANRHPEEKKIDA